MSDYGETSLRGMSVEAAREYVMGYLTTLKSTERELSVLREELSHWNGRAELAAGKQAVDLEAAARAKVSELQAKVDALEEERASLAGKIARMKEQLPMLKMTERSVDADLLLAQLQMATGEGTKDLLNESGASAASTDEALRKMGAESALDELKRKLAGGG